jgi:hypothetical protein
VTSPPAILYNTCYQIFNRGINGENIFIQERNFSHFLNLYAKYIEPIADTYAYCLLRNHFHLLVRIKSEAEISKKFYSDQIYTKPGNITSPLPNQTTKPIRPYNPSRQFSNFFNAYAKAINAKFGRTGSLFQHPFRRIQINSDIYFYRVMIYIHQNPQKHGFVEDFREWKYSSYGFLVGEKPTKMKKQSTLDWFGNASQYARMHDEKVDETINFPYIGEDND